MNEKDNLKEDFDFRVCIGMKMVRIRFDEVKEIGLIIEFGKEECGIGLGVCGFDLLKIWFYGVILVVIFV